MYLLKWLIKMTSCWWADAASLSDELEDVGDDEEGVEEEGTKLNENEGEENMDNEEEDEGYLGDIENFREEDDLSWASLCGRMSFGANKVGYLGDDFVFEFDSDNYVSDESSLATQE